ncbi:unnamed protein product, partial [Prunus brigantina]
GGAPARYSRSDGRMIYGVSEAITRVVLWHLEKSRVSHSRLKRSSKNICLMESDWGKQVVQSTFGIVKHGGTQNTLKRTRPFYSMNRCQGREEAPSHGRVLLGTNIAPTSLDSSVTAWVEAEWIPR